MTLTIVVGGQYGSEGKGAVAGQVHKDQLHLQNQKVAVRVAGSNAGHTVYDVAGQRFPFRQIPVAAVIDPEADLVIAAGSEVDPPVLAAEIHMCESAGWPVLDRLSVDASATVVDDSHKLTEGAARLTEKIGSTSKGIGAARADRIMRTAQTFAQWTKGDSSLQEELRPLVTDNTAHTMNQCLVEGARVLIEGTQGYGLGLHGAHYPKATSSDCRAIDFCAMAGISPWTAQSVRVLVCARSYPIRVAGNSGWMKGETTWEALGLEPEITTVTKKTRRVGEWDSDLLVGAVMANGGQRWRNGHAQVEVAWTMADQMFPSVRDLKGAVSPNDLPNDVVQFIQQIQDETKAYVTLMGTSPKTMVTL